MKYQIQKEFGGIPNGQRFVIEDTPETEKRWRTLQDEFRAVFSELEPGRDYSFADWHHGLMHVHVYTFTRNIVTREFLGRVAGLIGRQGFPCYLRFECEDRQAAIGRFIVFEDIVLFDETAKGSGLVSVLVGAD